MIAGSAGLLITLFYIFCVYEIRAIIEELYGITSEFRRGVLGTYGSITQLFKRQSLFLLRQEGAPWSQVLSAFRLSLIALLAGLLPGLMGDIPIDLKHSLWVYFCIQIAIPIIVFVTQWGFNQNRAWPDFLSAAERHIGSSTALLVVNLTLVAMTGHDTFLEISNIQREGRWLLFSNPVAPILLITYLIIHNYLNFQDVFARRVRIEKPQGWSLESAASSAQTVVGVIFAVNVFMGGDHGPMAPLFILIKCAALLICSTATSRVMVHLREDQAEAFMLWRLTPITILLLTLCLILSGESP